MELFRRRRNRYIEKGNNVNCSATLAVNNQSCLSILESGGSIGNGNYDLNVNGTTKNVYCDMTGGGWTLYDEFSSIYNARKPLNYTIENTTHLTQAGYSHNISNYFGYTFSDAGGTINFTNGYQYFFAADVTVGFIAFNAPKKTKIKVNYGNPYNMTNRTCVLYINNVTKETLQRNVFSTYISDVNQGDIIKIAELNAGICAIDSIWIL